jgi:hypothetical protein
VNLIVGLPAAEPERHGQGALVGAKPGLPLVSPSRPVAALAADVRDHGELVKLKVAAIGHDRRVAFEALEGLSGRVLPSRGLLPLPVGAESLALARCNVQITLVSERGEAMLDDGGPIRTAIQEGHEGGRVTT